MAFVRRSKLLSVENDSKTVKGSKCNVLTGILYLAPHTLSGYQVCPNATEGCKAACLFSAGRGVYQNVQEARINRTRWFFEDRDSFMEVLVKNIQSLYTKASKRGMKAAVRLNGTSDIAWEKIKVFIDGVQFRNVMEAFPDIQFYDYTKILNRKAALKIPNYALTFSLAENNDKQAKQAIDRGFNVSVVMHLRRSEPKPDFWSGYPVIDGDTHDIRFNDGKGNVVALHAKGKARLDTTGFVRYSDSNFLTN